MMTPEQAGFCLHFLMSSHEAEIAATKKTIAAIPEDQHGYQADPKSMTAINLAWHIVSSEFWFCHSLLNGSFGPEDNAVPEGSTIASIVAEYEAKLPGLLEQVKAIPADKLAAPIDFFGMFQLPAVAYINFMTKHSVHHRGQLAGQLRSMGSKVPSIYGPSADEPMQM